MITKSRLYATRIEIRRPKRNNLSKERDELMRIYGRDITYSISIPDILERHKRNTMTQKATV